MLPSFNAVPASTPQRLNAGTRGKMGVGLGQAITAAVVHPDRPAIHLSGDSAIDFSGRQAEGEGRTLKTSNTVRSASSGSWPGKSRHPRGSRRRARFQVNSRST
jgi:hypothetical protein